MVPLRTLLKNKLLIQKHYHVNEVALDKWPYWQLEENISIINELAEEEEKQKKTEEEKQKSTMPNFNPSSYMRDMNNLTSKFK